MSTVIAAIARTTMTTGVTYSFKTNYDYYYTSQVTSINRQQFNCAYIEEFDTINNVCTFSFNNNISFI